MNTLKHSSLARCTKQKIAKNCKISAKCGNLKLNDLNHEDYPGRLNGGLKVVVLGSPPYRTSEVEEVEGLQYRVRALLARDGQWSSKWRVGIGALKRRMPIA
jgi:hypothetical protein